MAPHEFKFSQPAVIDISIIIVSFNTREILLRCLSSVQKHTGGISYEVIVIDNASEDGTVEVVTKKFYDVKIIANKYNRGFSAANNQGILMSKGEKIAFLNPDTFLTENSFEKILKHMEKHPEFSILGSGVVDENNKPCPVRLWEDTPQDAALKIFNIYEPSSELEKMGEMKAKEVQVISGCCFVVVRELIETVGLMDENFFLYNEEDDYCRRARRKGMKICFYPETSIRHLHGKSTHQEEYREKVIFETYKSNLYFYSKYYSRQWNLILKFFYKVTFAAGLIRSIIKYITGRATVDDSIRLKIRLLLMTSKTRKPRF